MDENGTPTMSAVMSRIWKWPCELPHTVIRSWGVHHAVAECGLDVTLVDRTGAKLALDDDVRFIESLVDVANFEPGVAGYVVLERGVELGSALGHRVLGGGDGGQHLVIDVDQVESFLGLVDAVSGDRQRSGAL